MAEYNLPIASDYNSGYFIPSEHMICDREVPCEIEVRPISSFSPQREPFQHTKDSLQALKDFAFQKKKPLNNSS